MRRGSSRLNLRTGSSSKTGSASPTRPRNRCKSSGSSRRSRATPAVPQDARALHANLKAIVRILRARFVNLRLIYLSSRTYAGYAITAPEPQAYDSAFAARWLRTGCRRRRPAPGSAGAVPLDGRHEGRGGTGSPGRARTSTTTGRTPRRPACRKCRRSCSSSSRTTPRRGSGSAAAGPPARRHVLAPR